MKIEFHQPPVFNIIILKSVFAAFLFFSVIASPVYAELKATVKVEEQRATGVLSRPVLHKPIVVGNNTAQLKLRACRNYRVIEKGSNFPVCLLTAVDSSYSEAGDPVEAMVLVPIKFADQLIAGPGSILKGFLSEVEEARNVLKSKLSADRWLKSHATVSLYFNEIITLDRKHIPVSARPARRSNLITQNSPYTLTVNEDGAINYLTNGLKGGATGVFIKAASIGAGPAGIIVSPVLSGTAGAINPSYSMDTPVSKESESLRFRGMFNGIVKGLPGGSLFLGAKHDGVDITLEEGTQFQMELLQDLVLD